MMTTKEYLMRFVQELLAILLKDSSPEKIIDAIEEAVAGGAPMSLQIAHEQSFRNI